MTNPERMPWHLNGRQVAEWLGVSTKTVSQRDYPRTGKIGSEVLYDIREVLRVEAIKGMAISEGGVEIGHEAEKALWTRARRVAQDLDNLERLNLVAPVELFGSAFDQFCAHVSQVLEGLPGDIRRADPEISARSLEVIESKVAKFRNVAADACARLAKDVGSPGDIPARADWSEDTADQAAHDRGAMG